jgi:L-amino acid N-acyltransferase YncA
VKDDTPDACDAVATEAPARNLIQNPSGATNRPTTNTSTQVLHRFLEPERRVAPQASRWSEVFRESHDNHVGVSSPRTVTVVEIRTARHEDWEQIWPFFRDIVADGETYAYPDDLTAEGAKALWSTGPHGTTVVAVDGDRVLGAATIGPNRPGRGSHVATASFMVSPASRGRGVGRRLGEYALHWAADAGFRAMQFNAVVDTNAAAVMLWESLGFETIGIVPEAFDSRSHGLVGLRVMYRRLP